MSNLKLIVNSIFNSITYILPTDGHGECWLVDCGDIEKVVEQGFKVKGVLLTHCHFDHIYGINKLVDFYPNVEIYTNEEGMKGLINPRINFSKYHDEVEDFACLFPENIKLITREGGLTLYKDFKVEVLLTPGHDSSCISYIIGNKLFTGDAYIPGIKPVTIFPRSNKEQAAESLLQLQQYERNGYMICPGHSEIIKQ